MATSGRMIVACKRFKREDRPEIDSINRGEVILERATISVQEREPIDRTFETLYFDVADLLKPGFAKQFCEKLDVLIDSHTRKVMNQFQQNDLEPLHFLRQMNQCWRNHCEQLLMIKAIFLYLDRKYITHDSNVTSIWHLGVDKFRQYFSDNKIICQRTIKEILGLIQQERQGASINRTLVKDLLTMLSNLSIYKSTFEPNFLEETVQVYKAASQKLVNEKDVPDYLRYVSTVITNETERSNYYLDSLTKEPLIYAIENELLAAHLSLILSKGLDTLLDDMKMGDISLMHDLLGRVIQGHQELCTYFNRHIKQRGQVIVLNVDKDKTMVQDLLVFKERMDLVVNECFQKQERFVNSLKEAFEYFINKRPNKPAELIAKFLDNKLKSGNKEATEDELEKILDQILVLFRFIHGKDVFEAFYKKDLAKRLLVNKSASVDAEKSMLSKLKQECGAAFTGKLEGMFRDIETSKDMMTTFRNYLISHRIDAPIDMTVNVLTMGYWPTYEPQEVELPSFLLKHQNAFEKFYMTKHTGRRLQWQPNLGYCSLISKFESRHELMVSLFQALVLLMFNQKDEYSYEEIQKATKIEPLEMKRTLQSLACGKARVLTKEPKSKDINESDRFMFNAKFRSNLYKIKINQVQLRETNEEQSMTEERVFQDRQYQIDAAIVRIMKTRKKLQHNALVGQVFEQLKFPVKAYDVKVRIESLIERDYLHRDQDDATLYSYVA